MNINEITVLNTLYPNSGHSLSSKNPTPALPLSGKGRVTPFLRIACAIYFIFLLSHPFHLLFKGQGQEGRVMKSIWRNKIISLIHL